MKNTSRLSWTAPTSRPRNWRPTTTACGSSKAPRRRVYRLTDDSKTCIDLPAECVDYVFDFCDDAALYG